MNVWLLDSPDGAAAPFRILLAGFGAEPCDLLQRLTVSTAWARSTGPADLACAVSDAAGRAQAERWLAEVASPGVLTLLVGPDTGRVEGIDLSLPLPLRQSALARLMSMLDAMQRLTAETGVVCVEPDDLRFALRNGGQVWLAEGTGSGEHRAREAVTALLRALEEAGAEPGRGGRAVVAALGDTVADAPELGAINEAVQAWMGPAAMPVLGMREAGRSGRLQLLALLVTDRPPR